MRFSLPNPRKNYADHCSLNYHDKKNFNNNKKMLNIMNNK